jgi:hypothetical protein
VTEWETTPILAIAGGGLPPALIVVIVLMKAALLAGFVWAWRGNRLELLEFTKYKVFNDSGPDEPQPSPFNRMEREMNPLWIPWLFGAMAAWMLTLFSVIALALYFNWL